MKNPKPIPLDRALDPARNFASEAQRWWGEELESYGRNTTYDFEAYSTHVPDPHFDDLEKHFNLEEESDA